MPGRFSMAVMAGPWRLEELAAVADETVGQVLRYAEAGLLHCNPDGAFDSDSLYRLRLIQFARSRGVSDEELALATSSQGDLLSIFAEFDPPTEATVDLAAAARELDLDDAVVSELVEILDLEHVGIATESDAATVRAVAKAVDLGVPQDALMQLLRVFADATDRLADAMVRTFHDYVHERFRAQGLVGRELLDATRGVAIPAVDLVEPLLLNFHRRAYQRASREDLLRHLAERTTPPAAAPGLEEATVLFVDLASFTPLTATMGDQTAADILRRFSGTVRRNATRHRGRILKQIGDAFMLRFATPAGAIEFGLAMDSFVNAEPQFPALHIGAHHGSVLYREGDYVGATVNLAARVAAAGKAGQFLVTEALRDAVGSAADARFVALPPQRLKGLADPICLVEVQCHAPDQSDREADPVCGLQLRPDDVAARSTWRGVSYAFCCERCRRAFAENPVRFIAADQSR